MDVIILGGLPPDAGRMPELVSPDDLPIEHLVAGSAVDIDFAHFGADGVDAEWTWTDDRPGRQSKRQRLRFPPAR